MYPYCEFKMERLKRPTKYKVDKLSGTDYSDLHIAVEFGATATTCVFGRAMGADLSNRRAVLERDENNDPIYMIDSVLVVDVSNPAKPKVIVGKGTYAHYSTGKNYKVFHSFKTLIGMEELNIHGHRVKIRDIMVGVYQDLYRRLCLHNESNIKREEITRIAVVVPNTFPPNKIQLVKEAWAKVRPYEDKECKIIMDDEFVFEKDNISIIHEVETIAVLYALNTDIEESKRILVYHMGASILDIVLVDILKFRDVEGYYKVKIDLIKKCGYTFGGDSLDKIFAKFIYDFYALKFLDKDKSLTADVLFSPSCSDGEIKSLRVELKNLAKKVKEYYSSDTFHPVIETFSDIFTLNYQDVFKFLNAPPEYKLQKEFKSNVDNYFMKAVDEALDDLFADVSMDKKIDDIIYTGKGGLFKGQKERLISSLREREVLNDDNSDCFPLANLFNGIANHDDFTPEEKMKYRVSYGALYYSWKKETELVLSTAMVHGESKHPLNEVKMLLVGNGGAGKTSLMKRLLEKQFDKHEPQTHGINLENWHIKVKQTDIKVNIWDFGGQEIMHAIHQFFLSKRSLYILVLDSRKEDKTEYWLKLIRSFGSDSPVLLVLNKIDQNPAFEVDRKSLMKKYSNIKGFYRTSCFTGEGIDEFKQALNRQLIQVPHLVTIWEKNWFNVKEYLKNMKAEFIGYEEYDRICRDENITNDPDQHILLDFLHDLGVVLHFDDPSLKETTVINPEWATEAVYKVINSRILADNTGILPKSALKQILDEQRYPMQKHDFIIHLMKKFKLCFSPGEDTILIPDLLTEEEQEFEFDYNSALKYQIQYDFLPKSIIAWFIVQMHRDIKEDLVWRTGVVLENLSYSCNAVVKVDEKDRKLSVFVSGNQKRDYFFIIQGNLKEINNSFEKIDAQEMIPCNCKQCISLEIPYFYKYNVLVGALKKGVEKILCEKSYENVRIDDLLTGIKNYKWDLFISYSSKDKGIIKEIISDCKRYGISYWMDREEVVPGDRITDVIEEGLKNSRSFMACFSKNQLKSGWCRAEYKAVWRKIIDGKSKQKIFVLILDDLDPDDLPFWAIDIEYVRYSDKEGYKRLFKKLQKMKI